MTKPRIPQVVDMKDVRPYSDEDLVMTPALQEKIERLMKFFDEHGISYDKFTPERISFLTERKEAYPNHESYIHIPNHHNTDKWLHAVREIYKKEQSGSNRVQSIRQITSGWNLMETHDFLNWLRYYEAGNHLRYKSAQLWYENGAPGYFLPIKPDPAPAPEQPVNGQSIDFARQEAVQDEEKRQSIEKQRNKIIGRLDSAEKLLRSPEGQDFAGAEFEALMEAIYQLKKKIHMVNKMSTATRLYEDMIVREANVLSRDGFTKAATFLRAYAQANNPPPADLGVKGPINKSPTPTAPDSPLTPLSPGAPGGLPSTGPGMPQGAPPSAAPESGPNENSPTNLKGVTPPPGGAQTSGPDSPMTGGKETAIDGFLKNWEHGKNTFDDKSQTNDKLEISDQIEVMEADDLFVAEAQMAGIPPTDVPLTTDPAPAPLNPGPPAPIVDAPVGKGLPAPDAPATEEPLEVTEDDVAGPPGGDQPLPDASEFDAKIDAAFAGITVADVVAKLEDLAKIYKTRQVPRQLSVVDMMLDSLGLASYFPALSEAINKALESNNYISTRLEEIISRLRGAMETKDIDLKGDDKEKPNTAGIAGKLKEDQEKEKARKQQRKDMEAAELAGKGKEKPEVEMGELAPPPAGPPAPRPAPPG